MFEYDPSYVKEMSDPRFDPHLDLAKFAKAISEEDYNYFQDHKKDEKDPVVKKVLTLRKQYKVVNYSAVYGVGASKLSRELKCSVVFAQNLLEGYWKRNWSVRKVAENCEVKTVNRQKWLYNPVSKFWYSLRNEKDRFSTLNQGTGVYCFDRWVKECLKRRNQLTGQFHDEVCVESRVGEFESVKQQQLEAIKAVNDTLRLNVILSVDVKKGSRYSDIH